MERSEPVRRPVKGRLSRAFWAVLVALSVALVYLARHQPSWPWFSLWLLALLLGLAVLSLPAVRVRLNLSWFGVTLLILTSTLLFDLYLFHVETHRYRSERLEVRGVYLDADGGPIRVGVGEPDLDVRLQGSAYDFERWSVELRRLDASRFSVGGTHDVDMLRVRGPRRLGLWSPGLVPVLGLELHGGGQEMVGPDSEGEAARLGLRPVGRRGVLSWGQASVELAVPDALLDRRLSARLADGVPLAELAWDSLPDPRLASDLVLTRIRRGRSLGRFRLALPTYRLVSRASTPGWTAEEAPVLEPGDTLWVTSRGTTWAFAVDRVPGVSRAAAPVAVHFVQRPRPTGWALPSPEACGSDADRCAVLSTRPLPPPQPHFDLSGFGLDTARYAVLARLERSGDQVRVVGADVASSFPYGAVHPLPALSGGRADASTGILIRVDRTSQGTQGAVLVTVLTLYVLVLGGLLVLSGDARLWARRKSSSPHVSAAWGFLNVFLIFLGVRLALGLRVAYTPPFYDRAAATGVGLWITFTLMLVGLGRWSAWAPSVRRFLRRIERPLSRIFLPGLGSPPARGVGFPADRPDPVKPERGVAARDPETRGRRRRTAAGLALLVGSLALGLWQRPDAAPSLVVALVGLCAWLAMGVTRSGASGEVGASPLGVLTADAAVDNPSLSFAMAAGASVVLVLAMHAPELALAPVLALLLLFAVDQVVGWTPWAPFGVRRGWVLLGATALLLGTAAAAFLPRPDLGVGGVFLATAVAAVPLSRPSEKGGEARVALLFASFTELKAAIFAGVGWIGVLVVLGFLVFLNAQAIPPFVRFALVFMLFLLAIRAGLACRRVLEQGGGRGRFEALGLLVIPLGVLFVFMLFDFGLGLVFFAPMFVTVLLAARVDRLPGSLVLGSAAVVGGVLLVAGSVLRPSLDALRAAPDMPTFSEEYAGVGNPIIDVLRRAGLSGPITRATVRGIAASEPGLLEEALAYAGPSEALLAARPSRDQVWGGRAYAASGWTGTGFAGTTLLGRGVPTAVSYAENTFAVYVLAEHGALGGIAVLLAYLALLVVGAVWIVRVQGSLLTSPAGLAVLAMTVGGVLWLTIPAAYVAASNLALVPLTGQNMPFLGLNSWADVVLVSGLASGMVLCLAALDDLPPQEAES